jgi:hypothetical protein
LPTQQHRWSHAPGTRVAYPAEEKRWVSVERNDAP